MECDYASVDKAFSNYLLKLVGPNFEQDTSRENKFQRLKLILEHTMKENGIKAKIFNFGSFPIRTYLQDSDMDVTIVLEDEENKLNNLTSESEKE